MKLSHRINDYVFELVINDEIVFRHGKAYFLFSVFIEKLNFDRKDALSG